MKTDILDKCIEILKYENGDIERKTKLLSSNETDFHTEFVEPFRREVSLCLLTKTTYPEKKDLMTFYIDELDNANFFTREFKEIELIDTIRDGFIYPYMYEDQYETNEEGISEVRAHYLFSLLMDVIQDFCNVYHIPFLELCRERFFVLETISINSTIDWQERQVLADEIKELRAQPDQNARSIFLKKTVNEVFENQITEQPKPDSEKELKEIRVLENKFWKGLPMDQVVNHFEVLTKRKSSNGKVFLTPEQLVSFLKKGFLDDTSQPKQKINCSRGEKGLIIKRFYEFFDLAVSQHGYPSKKAKFIQLFIDCFNNWDPNTIATFFKRNKTKEIW
jgi:hypothetical protein